MNDLTAAQIIEQLSIGADAYERLGLQDTADDRRMLATLIEQQAEQIAQLTTTTTEDKRHMDRQAEQISVLRKVAINWQVFQGADRDIINGRQVDDALDEQANARAHLDELLSDIDISGGYE